MRKREFIAGTLLGVACKATADTITKKIKEYKFNTREKDRVIEKLIKQQELLVKQQKQILKQQEIIFEQREEMLEEKEKLSETTIEA